MTQARTHDFYLFKGSLNGSLAAGKIVLQVFLGTPCFNRLNEH